MRTHYERLGVAPHASHDEIRRAYRVLAQRHHPDSGAGDDAKMAEINAAWEILGDADKRRAYDWAIGTTPRPRVTTTPGPPESDGTDPEAEPDRPPRKSRPSDLLVAIPVGMFVVVLALFAFSGLLQSAGLRTLSILLFPVTGATFFAAPLFVMFRNRNRDGS